MTDLPLGEFSQAFKGYSLLPCNHPTDAVKNITLNENLQRAKFTQKKAANLQGAVVRAAAWAVLRLETHSPERTLRGERFPLDLLRAVWRAGQTWSFDEKGMCSTA